ncbi:uncharacterized protein BDCG_06626 [Blastomyces dermatitidis ER-3]|uniref:Uncharacterized protein n=1 Tax=Ajellomyces dermatitidis (strain ER-3 / ATCC MYA-2586) TaxID=559297 RepID=A0ABP2F570_AJEDR|nr:uncharacterized protein BDCG_06626 [Blastomyces dermatitidis ER-3]EEQ91506.2 hypothetical protein BDCG_06626 [Blastomyces dermatitidis ER-3]
MPEHGSGTPCIYLQPAVSQHNLAAAAPQKGGQLQGLHGLHGRNAGSQSGLEVLSPAHRWWVVDVYSDAGNSQYLNYVKDFWFSLINNNPVLMVKIDQHTVKTLQLMMLCSKAKCFKSWAHCLARLFTLGKSTVHQTMKGLWTTCSDGSDICPVQTSESAFNSQREPVGRQFDLASQQMWLYTMHHYPQMPRDPKHKNQLAKARNATADECVVSEMASLTHQLRFRSTQITNLINQAPDQLIAEQALLKAPQPEYFSYDNTLFDTLIDRIVECFTVAMPRDARCEHPSMEALEQDSPLLFVNHMQAAAVPDRVMTFFMRCCVYLAFFGPQPSLRQGADSTPSSVPIRRPEMTQARATDAPATDAPAAGDDAEVERAIADNLNEMLEGDAEQRAAGEHDAQEHTQWEREQRALLEIEHSALVENTRIKSEQQVAQERAMALTQLQSQVAEQTTDSAKCETNTATATLSRLITQFNARSMITGWRQQGSVLGNDEARPPQDTHKKTSTGHHGHIPVVHTQPGWHPEDPSSTPVPQMREPSSAMNMTATQAAVPNQLDGNAEEQAAEVPAQRADDKRQVVEPSALVQARRRHMENPAVELSSHLRGAGPEVIWGPSEEAAAAEAFPSASGQGDQGRASSIVVEAETANPAPPATVSAGRERRRKSNPGGIHKTQRAKPTRRDVDRVANRVDAISDELESRSDAKAAAPAVELTRLETREKGAHVRFDVGAADAELDQSDGRTGGGSRVARNIASRRGLRPRPVTQYNFRELAASSLTDPGGDSTNVADREAWPPTIPLPSIETEPEPARNDGKITITLHVYERKQWRVADVLSIDPSRKDALERIVWGYKRRGMFLYYDMRMRSVSVSSNFRAAMSDGANVLLLIPKEAKAQMDQECPIEPPNTAAGLLRKRSKTPKEEWSDVTCNCIYGSLKPICGIRRYS